MALPSWPRRGPPLQRAAATGLLLALALVSAGCAEPTGWERSPPSAEGQQAQGHEQVVPVICAPPLSAFDSNHLRCACVDDAELVDVERNTSAPVSSQSDGSQSAACVCKPGMFLKGDRCVACAQGTFKTGPGNEQELCLSCPESGTSGSAAGFVSCECALLGWVFDPNSRRCTCWTKRDQDVPRPRVENATLFVARLPGNTTGAIAGTPIIAAEEWAQFFQVADGQKLERVIVLDHDASVVFDGTPGAALPGVRSEIEYQVWVETNCGFQSEQPLQLTFKVVEFDVEVHQTHGRSVALVSELSWSITLRSASGLEIPLSELDAMGGVNWEPWQRLSGQFDMEFRCVISDDESTRNETACSNTVVLKEALNLTPLARYVVRDAGWGPCELSTPLDLCPTSTHFGLQRRLATCEVWSDSSHEWMEDPSNGVACLAQGVASPLVERPCLPAQCSNWTMADGAWTACSSSECGVLGSQTWSAACPSDATCTGSRPVLRQGCNLDCVPGFSRLVLPGESKECFHHACVDLETGRWLAPKECDMVFPRVAQSEPFASNNLSCEDQLPWTKCSAVCGGGHTHRTRETDDETRNGTVPTGGGRGRSCNTAPCDPAMLALEVESNHTVGFQCVDKLGATVPCLEQQVPCETLCKGFPDAEAQRLDQSSRDDEKALAQDLEAQLSISCRSIVTPDGVCCASKSAVLDSSGACCESGVLDRCGTCNSTARFVDLMGKCCNALDALGYCCDRVDAMGVCEGTASAVTEPICGNGVCEVGEACSADDPNACCPIDCPFVLRACPSGSDGRICGGAGRCLPSLGKCDCFRATGRAQDARNSCNTGCRNGFVETSKGCVHLEAAEKLLCTNGIQNYLEEGLDCGGICARFAKCPGSEVENHNHDGKRPGEDEEALSVGLLIGTICILVLTVLGILFLCHALNCRSRCTSRKSGKHPHPRPGEMQISKQAPVVVGDVQKCKIVLKSGRMVEPIWTAGLEDSDDQESPADKPKDTHAGYGSESSEEDYGNALFSRGADSEDDDDTGFSIPPPPPSTNEVDVARDPEFLEKRLEELQRREQLLEMDIAREGWLTRSSTKADKVLGRTAGKMYVVLKPVGDMLCFKEMLASGFGNVHINHLETINIRNAMFVLVERGGQSGLGKKKKKRKSAASSRLPEDADESCSFSIVERVYAGMDKTRKVQFTASSRQDAAEWVAVLECLIKMYNEQRMPPSLAGLTPRHPAPPQPATPKLPGQVNGSSPLKAKNMAGLPSRAPLTRTASAPLSSGALPPAAPPPSAPIPPNLPSKPSLSKGKGSKKGRQKMLGARKRAPRSRSVSVPPPPLPPFEEGRARALKQEYLSTRRRRASSLSPPRVLRARSASAPGDAKDFEKNDKIWERFQLELV